MPPAFVRLAVMAVFLGLITFWFYRRLIRATGVPKRPAKIALVLLVVLGLTTLVGFQSGDAFDPDWARPIAFLGMTWLAVVFYLALGLILTGLACLVARGVRLARRQPAAPPEPSRRRALQIATGGLTLAAFAAVGVGLVSAARPRITKTQVRLTRLPAGFVGVRIALITDLHAGPSRGADFVQKVVDLVAAEKPDLIVYGGDLVDGTVAHVGDDLRPLAALRAPLGIFGVSGNHEYYADGAPAWMRFWEQIGIRPLRNERVAIERDGDSIDIAGIFDARAPEPDAPDLAKAVRGRARDRFLLLAAHQPLQVEDARRHGVDLQLSGHTHGGQIWPFHYAVELDQPMLDGLETFGATTVYASRGAGAWGPPVRVGAPPEVAILELVQKR